MSLIQFATPPNAGRRQFIQGLAGTAALGGLSPLAWAQQQAHVPELHGPVFDLTIGEIPHNVTGTARTAHAINGSVPAPTLRWKEGEEVTIRVKNTLPYASSIHWHGILLPANMDGVPGLSFKGIPAGETFTYRFRLKQSGTYWYHSHSGFQEQLGMYGAIVVEPREADPVSFDADKVLVLSDWTDEEPMRVFTKLKAMSDYYNFRQQTVADLMRDVKEHGLRTTLVERAMWGEMRMMPTDLADISGYTYTYLANGHSPAANHEMLFKPGQRLRLRIVNAAAMSFFDVRIPGLKMTVVAADGQNVHPVTVDEFRIGVAETYDVIVQPAADTAYTVFAQSYDRSGYARATLTPRRGVTADVPSLDPRPLLTMADMGHGAGHGSGHGAHGNRMQHQDHSQHAGHQMDHSQSAKQGMSHAGDGDGDGMQSHHPSEKGNPAIDMLTMSPSAKLDDPGIGLRDNGRDVLTYSRLKSLFPDPDGREASREIELHLTGHMERYIWAFNGIKFSDSDAIRLKYGERVRFTLVNDTMMEHPIHLHGVWSDLEHEDGSFGVRKHTINMPPGTRRSYLVTADALGRWAYHCHLLFHMEAGMMREVRIDV